MKHASHTASGKHLEEIWEQVPPDYYQKGISSNILQKFWHTNKLKEVIHVIKLLDKKPKNILDVGCAGGWFISQLGNAFPRVKCTGVDVYQDAISYGKKMYPHITFHCIDAHKLPFKDHTFDVLVSCEVLEHVIDVNKVLQEMRRVVAPEGKVIIEIDSGNILFKLAWFWWTNMRKGVWRDAHLHAFTIDVLEDLFVKNGFIIEKKKVFNASMAVIFLLSLKK